MTGHRSGLSARMWLIAAVAILATGLAGVARAGFGEFEPLTIVTAKGRHDFKVEVMRSVEEQARGMMFRRSLTDDKGMLFVFPDNRVATFWMQNTYIPLDMIFIKADGVIARIERNATPLSTDEISSGVKVRAVLEINGGEADRLGIRAGDRVKAGALAPK